MFTLDFEEHLKGYGIKKSFFTNYFKLGIEVLEREGKLKKFPQGGSIHLVMLSDEQIAELNSQYRQKNKPTDVLSFSYYEEAGFPGENLIGEIAISLPTAKKQAKEHRKTLKQEVQFLFIHGLLHVFGYDHELADERKVMFDLQDEIWGTNEWRAIIEP